MRRKCFGSLTQRLSILAFTCSGILQSAKDISLLFQMEINLLLWNIHRPRFLNSPKANFTLTSCKSLTFDGLQGCFLRKTTYKVLMAWDLKYSFYINAQRYGVVLLNTQLVDAYVLKVYIVKLLPFSPLQTPNPT